MKPSDPRIRLSPPEPTAMESGAAENIYTQEEPQGSTQMAMEREVNESKSSSRVEDSESEDEIPEIDPLTGKYVKWWLAPRRKPRRVTFDPNMEKPRKKRIRLSSPTAYPGPDGISIREKPRVVPPSAELYCFSVHRFAFEAEATHWERPKKAAMPKVNGPDVISLDDDDEGLARNERDARIKLESTQPKKSLANYYVDDPTGNNHVSGIRRKRARQESENDKESLLRNRPAAEKKQNEVEENAKAAYDVIVLD